ncbi:MAG: PKD domain-containing protein [Deinococcota bacterium]
MHSRTVIVMLSVVLVACSSSSDPAPVNRAPSGQLSVTPTSGQAPLDIRATVTASDPDGDAITLSWQVDGIALDQTGNTLDYTFAQAGNYTLSVIVSDGELTTELETPITVIDNPDPNQLPTAAFMVDVTNAPTISFDASTSTDPDGTIQQYRWDFGDGTGSEGGAVDGVQTSHRYSQAGTFSVRLTVTDDDGASASSSQDVTINVPNLRPTGSPDVVIVGFAGRCGVLVCVAPEENTAYLDGGARTLQTLQNTLQAEGYSVEYQSYAARLSADVPSVFTDPPVGYLEAEAYLENVYNDWIDGFDNPTRVITVGHSHGTVWMNLLLFNQPDISVDYAISLDGICLVWWDDHEPSIQDYYDRQGFMRPFPLASGSPCNRIEVSGQLSLKDLNDVMPDNVRVNLEVQAGRFIPSDTQENFRLDGSRQGIYTIRPSQTHGGTSGVHYHDGPGMSWVSQQLQTLGFLEDDEPVPSSRSIARRVPAPPGFEYVD